jgi:CheY-like chemotaxis protein
LPDIIFLDVNMLQVTGWECLTRIKNSEQYRDIPVIMYSTSASNLDKQKAKKLGASGFLTKPSDFRMLVDILKKLAAMEEVSLWELSER